MSGAPIPASPDALATQSAFWTSVAQHWGQAPGTVFVLWLLTVAAIALPLGSYMQRDSAIRRPLYAPLGNPASAWMLLAATLWAALAWQVAHNGPVTRLDTTLAHTLSLHVHPALLHLFGSVSHLADTPVLTAACIAGTLFWFWRKKWPMAIGWVWAIAGNALLNTGLKQWVGRVRPEHLEGYTMAGGLSFPSGHSSGALVAYGMLAWILLHRHPHWPRGLRAALITLAALAVAAVGYSRIGLQVHYLTDVLGGWLSGSIWLLGSIGLVRALERRRLRA